MQQEKVGAPLRGTSSQASPEAAEASSPVGFDPARGLNPDFLRMLAAAERLLTYPYVGWDGAISSQYRADAFDRLADEAEGIALARSQENG